MNVLTRTSILVSALAAPALALGADPQWQEAAAARLSASTVTVRIWPGQQAATNPEQPDQSKTADGNKNQSAGAQASGDQVIVCSGVCVGRGLIVTCGHPLVHRAPAAARFRITQPDGQQSKAALCVLDHYSNLCLLATGDDTLPALDLAAEQPHVGAPILTAAAAGIDRPVVSLGIVGGIDRTADSSGLPPLLQCDLRTTETSGGAAVVDRHGKLLGVVMAADLPGERSGWTFAVPIRHLQRVLDARREDELVVLQRRRPTVGLTLGQGPKEGSVVVERVVSGGPAAKADVRAGDLIVEASGRKIRSAYQAVDLILARQPGETIGLVVERAGERRPIQITLGGEAGTSLPRQSSPAFAAPQVNVRVVGRNRFEVRNAGAANVAELAAGNNAAPQRAPRDELGMLQLQLQAFEKVIAKLQAEVRRRDQLLEETSELVKSLTAEVESLRKQPGPGK
jgi:S1-C subfamily serine protease